MTAIEVQLEKGRIEGTCDTRFSAVADEFRRNFEEREEVGASVCLTLDGEVVVDLWGGIADTQKDLPWTEDTVSIVYSCTKAAVALCAHILVCRGELDIEAPVKRYWPEFAQAGKEDATVRMMLNHSVGVPALRDKVKDGGCTDFDYMCGLLEAEKPFWKPGTRNGYHMLTFGWTVGELVRRVSGMSLGAFFREAVTEPLGIDFWIGLPEDIEARVAPIILADPVKNPEPGTFVHALIHEGRHSLQSLALFNVGGFNPNDRACRAAEIGGGGGVTNARGLAGMFAPLSCGGGLGGVTLVDEDTLSRMGRVSIATDEDATLLIATRFALGFMKSMDNHSRLIGDRDSVIMSDAAFGHAGAGGSLGFADPEAHMSFAYTMNRMGQGILVNDRGQSLVDAAYQSLGYTSKASGAWVKY